MSRFAAELAWIDHQQERMRTLLERWGNINSGTYHLAGLETMRREVAQLASELVPRTGVKEIALPPQEIIDEKGRQERRELGNTLAFESANPRMSSRGRPKVFLGIHMDTVFGAGDAFQAVMRLEKNVLRGPGVCDAKGGLIVMLFALMALQRSSVAEGIAWEVLINPDEEIGSPGSGPLFAQAAARNDLGLLFEPALPDGALVSARKGSGNFVLVVHGVPAHAGRDSGKGRNAIHALAELITKLAAVQREIAGITVNTGAVSGGGPVNIVPDLAIGRVNVRVENPAQQAEFESRLAAILAVANVDGIRVESQGGFHCPPKMLNPPIEALLQEFQTCAEQLGLPLTWRATGGACDGNRLAAAGLPTIDSLGVRGGNMHTSEEFLFLDSLAERTKLTALFLMRLAAGEITVDRLRQDARMAPEVQS